MSDTDNVAGCLSIIAIALMVIGIVCICGFSCWNKYVHGNKQFIDLKQEFNTAYVKVGDKVERVMVKAWNDYDKSDTVQVVTVEGKVYYTHSANVVLTNEEK